VISPPSLTAAGFFIQRKIMNLPGLLLTKAAKLASRQTVRRVELSAEIGRLEGRRSLSDAERAELEDIRSEAENCGQALVRFAGYRPYGDAEPKCPHCWIVRGESSFLRPGAKPETYRCAQCEAEYP
jgi:hypothetical protein